MDVVALFSGSGAARTGPGLDPERLLMNAVMNSDGKEIIRIMEHVVIQKFLSDYHVMDNAI